MVFLKNHTTEVCMERWTSRAQHHNSGAARVNSMLTGGKEIQIYKVK